MYKVVETFLAVRSHVIGKPGSKELCHYFLTIAWLCHHVVIRQRYDFLILTSILCFMPIAQKYKLL